MIVRAKFQVHRVQQNINHEGKVTSVDVLLGAVSQGSPGDKIENRSFWEATPSGQLTMTINNPDLRDHFVPGQTYYLDISPVPTEAPA